MQLQALHHVTMITADAPSNVAFYGDVLGLRLIKKTVNFDQAQAYHLNFGDEQGSPGYDERGREGAGTVHHIAWHSRDEDHLAWQARVREAGQHVTEVRDRDYFRAIYFRTPQGILFELAETSPGFAVDEDSAHLGEELRVPAMHAHLREHLEQTLIPLVNHRA